MNTNATSPNAPADAGFHLQFASDNTSGICPQAWAAMAEASAGYAPSYGDDEWTRRASDQLREVFETDCDVYFVFNGTAANGLALAALCASYQSVICHPFAHVETDECGAPEFMSNGSKILLAGGEGGRLDPAAIEEVIRRRTDIHYPRPRVVSLTQATELGTVYPADRLREIGDLAGRHGLRMHMDGARFANAVATLGVPPAELSWRAGVDVICFSGTKNGVSHGEAVVFFDRELSAEFAYRCKQAGQLASKMRFITAPWCGMLASGSWLENARTANRCARYLARRIEETGAGTLMFPVEANAVFVELQPAVARRLKDLGWHFYSFIGLGGARFMCNWSTTEADVDRLVADMTSGAPAP